MANQLWNTRWYASATCRKATRKNRAVPHRPIMSAGRSFLTKGKAPPM